MIIRCDNCSVSLQLDESKVPGKAFTVRCPRCQNLVRVALSEDGHNTTVDQLANNGPAPAIDKNGQEFQMRESEFQINSALKSLLMALQTEKKTLESDDNKSEKPRRVLLCMGAYCDATANILVQAGFKVYIAKTPAQANERLREGKTEILLFSPDFAAEFGGTAIIQQKINAMYASERRRLFLVSIEDGATTLNAHEAFLRNLNLIISSDDLQQLPLILNRSLQDFNDLYLYFNRATGAEAI
ncbi:MAG: zinc-ribbon domain-containing protein [Pyrinomonadaceae bacterium]